MKLQTVLLAFVLLLPQGAHCQTIRLRNEVIDPSKEQAQPARLVVANTAPGLYLLRFSNSPPAALRSRLAVAGVELIRYVPDDAFLVRVHNTLSGGLRALPGVVWSAPYLAGYKVDKALQAASKNSAVLASPMPVSIVLAPGASLGDLSGVRGLLSKADGVSSLRSGKVLRGEIAPAQLSALAGSSAVLWVEPSRPMKLFDEVASKIVAGDGGENKLYAQSLGYDGDGVTVAVADSGLHNGDSETMHPDLAGRTPEFFYYGKLEDAADEHSHGTHVAGIIAGNGAVGETDDDGALFGLGVAPGASIITQRIFDGEGGYEAPPSFERLTRDAVRAGADIASNSWGDDTGGRYDVSAMEFDELVRDADALMLGDQQYIIEFSAGNAGPGTQTIGSPAVAKNVLATGASQNDRYDFVIYAEGADSMSDFSSRGPCEDGRIKPDVVAPGSWIASLQSASATDQYAWAPISENYLYQGGTSQAGPHASGAAAVFVQYYREEFGRGNPSPALVKAALINTAVDMTDEFGTAAVPNMDEGWGRLDLTPFFDLWRVFSFHDQATLLTNSQVYEERMLVAGPEDSLKVTLTYTDLPGFPGAAVALVNDLDLEVIGPDGTLYRGNQMSEGESVPNPPAADAINNVESVILNTPAPGEYVVRVRARRIVEDARADTPQVDQDFALVTSAVTSEPGYGELFLDRLYYRAPGLVKITLIDTDLAGQAAASVSIRSTSDAVGEVINLTSSSGSGVFTGAVAVVTGPAAGGDGLLQVAHGNVITAAYQDLSTGQQATATAHGDLQAPVLTAVTFTNRYSQAVVSWRTDEASSSAVFFGTNNSMVDLPLGASDVDLVTEHSLVLSDLVPGRTYYFYVTSTDEAGNLGTNANAGAFYSFVAASTAGLLLVDQFLEDPFVGVAPSLAPYTQVLDQLQVPYEVWDVASMGSPTNVIDAYRTVIWRVQELGFAVPTVWTSGEQNAISNYLYTGGSMLVASMELLSRLDEVYATNFIRDVLHVQSFEADPVSGVDRIVGPAAEPITSGLDISLDYQVYDDLWGGFIGPDISDIFTPATNATALLRDGYDSVVGLRWPGLGQQAPGRLVFLSFPLDAVPYADGVNDRLQLMRSILSFLAPGITGSGNVALDSTAYNLPSLVRVEIGDLDLGGTGTITVKATSSTQTNGISLTLHETSSPGVFSGTFYLVDTNAVVSAAQLVAQPGDTVSVEYADASSGKAVQANALVDINPPTNNGVEVEPDYSLAVVFWETSEPTSSLVQFGKSAILDRTAYDPELVTSHYVTLPFLEPDQLYRFQVTSTDAAKNSVLDDNHGQLYSFKTLKPIYPPWTDNLDSGAEGWSVYNPDGGTPWLLGTPSTATAPSPPNVWSSNLGGEAMDIAEKYLISPAIYLTNGNSAKLTFKHNYDFSDLTGFDLEYGVVELIVDNSNTQVDLGAYMDVSMDWEEAEFDLTPYMGKIVYVVWYYLIFTMDSGPRPGWMIDDVAVTVETVPTGRIEITNNLSQAEYLLSGPTSYRGKGLGTVIADVPAGEYLLEYVSVTNYVAPASQTQTLEPGGVLRFTGQYTFADSNHNGIPDTWEVSYFGQVDPGRTALTDTDSDGQTDYAEFISGSNPTNTTSNLEIGAITQSETNLILSWPSARGRSYTVERLSGTGSWEMVMPWERAGADGILQYTDTLTNRSQIYRVQVRP